MERPMKRSRRFDRVVGAGVLGERAASREHTWFFAYVMARPALTAMYRRLMKIGTRANDAISTLDDLLCTDRGDDPEYDLLADMAREAWPLAEAAVDYAVSHRVVLLARAALRAARREDCGRDARRLHRYLNLVARPERESCLQALRGGVARFGRASLTRRYEELDEE